MRFLIGLVEGHGVEGVAAIFGVSRLSQYMLTNSDASKAKDFSGDRIGEEEFGDALRGNGSGGDNEGGSGGGSVDLSGVHCITLCWMLATRTLDIHSSALSPKGLLLADLVEVCGRLLDLIVGHVDTQKWSEVDDEIIIRQMSKRTSHDVHPALQKQLKNNPFSNLW